MKAWMLMAACVVAPAGSWPESSFRSFQEEDLSELSVEKLAERLKTASATERGRIIKELERRGVTVLEQTDEGGGDDERDAKETLRTEHFDLKGPDKETLARKAKELDALGKRFTEIFGAPPKRGVIIFHRDRGEEKEKKAGPAVVRAFTRMIRMNDQGESWTLPWPLVDAKPDKDLPLNPEQALTHEVMHILFVKYVAEKFPDLKPKVTVGGYQVGSPLPDWLDEGLAVLAEPENFRAWREKDLRETLEGTNPLSQELLPLEKLVAMDHPIVDGKGNSINLFYAQSHALVDHWLREAGASSFRDLIAGLAEGHKFEDLLKDGKTTRGKLPSSIRELEADLKAKIAQRRQE